MSEKLKQTVLKKEREILKELGCELSAINSDKEYPDSYYKEYEYNLFEKMGSDHKKQYGEGSGGELEAKHGKRYSPAKMASIRSSSAMTFNLLGNDQVYMKADNCLKHSAGKYQIAYEKQITTIESSVRQSPANLDAFLVSEDGTELIFCEMKMMEWFDKNKGVLKESYIDRSNYPHKNLYAQFMKAREVIQTFYEHGDFTHYDVWQMFKHTLAVHNYVADHAWDNIRKVTLVNVVFEPTVDAIDEPVRNEYAEQVAMEHKGFAQFRFALYEAGLIEVAGKNFDVKYLSAREFMDCFDITDERRKYLKRYTFEE